MYVIAVVGSHECLGIRLGDGEELGLEGKVLNVLVIRVNVDI